MRSFPALTVTHDLEDALDLVDAVVLATPPSTHAPLALQALEAGKHVMVEKPLATRLVDAVAMRNVAAERGLVLMVGHTFEYHAAVWKLREMVDRGELGDLYYVDTARLNLGLYQHDVDVMLDLAPHDISILNYVLRSQPVAVECWASRHAHRELEDIAYLRLYYESPTIQANIHVSWLDPCKVRRMTLVGSSKMVVFDDLATEERIRVHDKGVVVPEESRPDQAAHVLPVRRSGGALPHGERATRRRGRALRGLRAHRDDPADRRRQRRGGRRGARGGGALQGRAPDRPDRRGPRGRRGSCSQAHTEAAAAIPRQRAVARAAGDAMTRTSQLRLVPFLDLAPVTLEVRDRVLALWKDMLERTAFVGGPAVEDFERPLRVLLRHQ